MVAITVSIRTTLSAAVRRNIGPFLGERLLHSCGSKLRVLSTRN